MYREERTFTLRFSLEAAFPDDYEGDEDHHTWTREWEAKMKPELLKVAGAYSQSRQVGAG